MQSDLLVWLSASLLRLGPGVLFAVCLLETAAFAGLVLPVGALIAFAAILSARGALEPGDVLLVSLAGALIGDQMGFLVGRWFVPRARRPTGGIARLWRAALSRMEALVVEHGVLGVSVARATPFVRTIMPWFAGRSGMPWARFLLLDLLGIALWGSLYIGGGFLAGYGWRRAAGSFGELAGAALLAVALLVVLYAARQWLQRLLRRDASTP